MSLAGNLFSHIQNTSTTIHHNLDYDQIYSREQRDVSGKVTSNGTYCIYTGKFTGRSPKDKYFVRDENTKDTIWWGSVNQPISQEVFTRLADKVKNHYESLDTVYVFEGFCGSDGAYRKRVRFITEYVWQHHFVKNMFLEATEKECKDFVPDFTIINASSVTNTDYKEDGLRSENFVAFSITEKLGLIGGTAYTGEMKKGIFSLMKYWLPLEDNLVMHCSANTTQKGDTALFFGLSGTGKTTLSADPNRLLIGDDEHAWTPNGIFNIEGGCYAKTINLSEEKEPDIYRAIRKDALLENVVLDAAGNIDYDDSSITENTRVSYPIEHIDNLEPSLTGAHPKNIIFLTCDALGVLPVVAKLTPEQAMYHFLSGYTSKVAGTELGITEPTSTFSACFGEAFLTLHPQTYAQLLKKRIEEHNVNVYLVNTGWVNGKYGVGKRVSIKVSRACISAILDDSINTQEFRSEPYFDLQVPLHVPGVEDTLLRPEDCWASKQEYETTAATLRQAFADNLVKKDIDIKALGL